MATFPDLSDEARNYLARFETVVRCAYAVPVVFALIEQVEWTRRAKPDQSSVFRRHDFAIQLWGGGKKAGRRPDPCLVGGELFTLPRTVEPLPRRFQGLRVIDIANYTPYSVGSFLLIGHYQGLRLRPSALRRLRDVLDPPPPQDMRALSQLLSRIPPKYLNEVVPEKKETADAAAFRRIRKLDPWIPLTEIAPRAQTYVLPYVRGRRRPPGLPPPVYNAHKDLRAVLSELALRLPEEALNMKTRKSPHLKPYPIRHALEAVVGPLPPPPEYPG